MELTSFLKDLCTAGIENPEMAESQLKGIKAILEISPMSLRREREVGVRCLLTLFYNTDFDVLAKRLYTWPMQQTYHDEKLKVWESGLINFFGVLDAGRQRKMMDFAYEKYGKEARIVASTR